MINNLFKIALQQVGINISAEQLKMLDLYYKELLSWNKKFNLTAIEGEEQVIEKHFYDSLLGMKAGCWSGEGELIDIGTGAGFPGIPLKIMNPEIKLTLVDSLNKRIVFLEHMIKELKLTGIITIHGRAEELGQKEIYREEYDYVVSRAVAKMNVLLEYCLPFLKTGGFFIVYKGSEGDIEIEQAQNALKVLNGSVSEKQEYYLPFSKAHRKIIVVRKERETPKQYPRHPGTPEKRPL